MKKKKEVKKKENLCFSMHFPDEINKIGSGVSLSCVVCCLWCRMECNLFGEYGV